MCHGHIASHHFEEYTRRCDEAIPPIKPNFRCTPKAAQEVEWKGLGKQQGVLNFPKVNNFVHESILDAVAKLIACDDQVSLGFRFRVFPIHRFTCLICTPRL
jgi:hypothetical protein